MIRQFSFSALLVFFYWGLFAQTSFSEAVDAFQQNPQYKNSTIGIVVTDLESGKTIFGLNAEKLLIPASTLKLVTSSAALEILGDNYRFETTIGYSGHLGNSGNLQGDLVLLGGGDPALGSEYFRDHYFDFLKNWVRRLSSAGIKRVKGDLILDASIYDNERVPATWIWEDLGNYYGAGPNAFTVYDNLFRITFRSPKKAGKATEIISTYPEIQGIEFNNSVLSSDVNRDNAYVFGSPLDSKREIRGTIPADRRAFTIRAAIPNPGEVLAGEVLRALAGEGIFVNGKIRFQKVDRDKVEKVFVQQSPPLSEIVKMLNHESINLFAEHLLKQIAFEKSGLGSRETGINLVREFWKTKGIDVSQLFMEDGSGLSHFNAATPAFFIQLLTEMADNPTFVNSLPEVGAGTLSNFDKTLLPGNTIRAKSGSMTRVRCYGGYLTADSGKQLAFSIMVNHFSGSHSDLVKEIQTLLLALKKNNPERQGR